MPTDETRKYLIHPSYIVLGLVLLAVTSLFLAFSASYIYTRVQHHTPPVKLPYLFFINALILLFSSLCLSNAKVKYEEDNTDGFKMSILIAFVLSVIFMISQFFAWQQMMDANLFINFSNMTAYIYLISSVHLLHVLGGIPFLLVFYIAAVKYMKDPITVLLYFSDESKFRKLKLLSIYWHYLDFLWIYLILFFLINQWIT